MNEFGGFASQTAENEIFVCFVFFSGFLSLIFQLLIIFFFFHSDLQRDRTEAKHLMSLARNTSGVLTSLEVPWHSRRGMAAFIWVWMFL